MIILKKIVFLGAAVVFLTWLVVNYAGVAGDDEGFLRLALGLLFALLVMLRRKPREESGEQRQWIIPAVAIAGALFVVAGRIMMVHQFEWLGIIMVLYAAFRWSLPGRYSEDILFSLFLLYWVNPLPGQVFNYLQAKMQYLSVSGAEWMLQCANVRVWADSMVLRTGFAVFGVPAECSGMRTIVTVFICTLGVGILFRLKWYEIIPLIILGGIQVLLLNIVRISLMVYWAPRMSPAWAEGFLHDSLTIFLLLSIFLAQAEASWWKLYTSRKRFVKDAIAREEVEPPDMADVLPRFWHHVAIWFRLGLTLLLVIAALSFAFYKRRDDHRAVMISDVVEGLMTSDLPAAEAAINEVLKLQPNDRSQHARRAHILILRKKNAEVLQELDSLPPPFGTFEIVMKSWALMSLDRIDEAMSLVQALPETEQKNPQVAVVRAGYAAKLDRPDDTASNVVTASRAVLAMERVRMLYPYLAAHAQWRAIAQSDNPAVPYGDVVYALLAFQANLEINDIAAASTVLRRAMDAWPNDPRLLNGMYYMAYRHAGTGWEESYSRCLLANLAKLDADTLSEEIEFSFKLVRPDLGWLACKALSRIDPTDPSLFLMPAKFADSWFLFRRHALGIRSDSRESVINLNKFCLFTRNLQPFESFWKLVPLSQEQASARSGDVRAQFLARGLAELEKREAAGTITERMEMMFPSALAMSGQFETAHARLDRLAVKYPDRKREMMFQHAEFYYAENRWQESYEALRRYFASGRQADFSATMMMVDNMMNLNLGIGAMEIATQAKDIFPGSWRLRGAIAAIWDCFGFKEQALFLLREEKNSVFVGTKARLFYETGRYEEADRLASALNIAVPSKRPSREIVPPMAEKAVTKRWARPFTAEEMVKEAELAEKEANAAKSPFIRDLKRLEGAFFRTGGQGAPADAAAWKAIGRDAVERACALHRLGVLLARQKDYGQAVKAVQMAIGEMPKSGALWRILVALTDGKAETAKKAREACPDDPELWLAYIVCRMRDEGAGNWIKTEVNNAADSNVFSTEAMVRAGEFLLRNKQAENACILARSIENRSEELFSAHLLSLACALASKDVKWAISASLDAVKTAMDPLPFYKMLVVLKSAGKNMDADMIASLEYLRGKLPKETVWGEQLGAVYFEKGDTARALSILAPIVDRNIRDVAVNSILVAAEAARIQGDLKKTVSILQAARSVYPDRVSILNNLVYALAQDPATVKQAVKLLPDLLATGDESSVVLDTIATVYMKNGQMDLAKKYMEKALAKVSKQEYAALEMNINAAELLFLSGDTDRSMTILKDVIKEQSRSDLVNRRARELLISIQEATQKRE